VHLPGTRSRLVIRLLGPPIIEWAGEPLPIQRRSVRAILFRLACAEKPISRSCLSSLFWPDDSDGAARRKLSHRLNHLKISLPDPEVLQTGQDLVWLHPDSVWCDAQSFYQLVKSKPANPGAIDDIVSLYRGPFLSGFDLKNAPEFDDWASLQRSYFERAFLERLKFLIKTHTANSAYKQAVHYCQLHLAVDNLAEEVHCQLIALYGVLGEQQAALQQFEQCRSILEKELQASPCPETLEVYRAIRQRRKPAIPSRRAPASWTTRQTLEVPLVGRGPILQTLENVYQRVTMGSSTFVLLTGEAGIGKSRLVEEFGKRMEEQALVLSGAGRPGVVPAPFYPLVQAIRPLVAAGHLSGLDRCWLAEASRLLPELRIQHAALSRDAVGDEEHRHLQMMEALCQIVIYLAGTELPIIFCLEDIHWADRFTLDWLLEISRRVRRIPFMVLLSCRAEDRNELNSVLEEIGRLNRLVEIELEGLKEIDVARLVRNAAGRIHGIESFSNRLFLATGGNPFYVLEILRNLLEAGQCQEDGLNLSSLPIPKGIKETIHTRLARLTETAREVLEAGAVLGNDFSFTLIINAAGLEESQTVDALEELVEHQLLVEKYAQYTFNHEITRQVVESGLSEARQILLHRRAAYSIMEMVRKKPEHYARLAYHFYKARRYQPAVRTSIKAGRLFLKLYDIYQSAFHFKNALKWANEGELDLDKAVLAKVHMFLGDALRRRASYEEAQHHYQLALPHLDPAYKQAAAYHICTMEALRGGSLDSHSRLIEMLGEDVAQSQDPVVFAVLKLNQGIIHAIQGRGLSARKILAEGLLTTRRLSNTSNKTSLVTRAYFHSNLARCYIWWGKWSRAVHHTEIAMGLYSKIMDKNGKAVCHLLLGTAFSGWGAWEAAQKHFNESLRLAEGARDPRIEGDVLFYSALLSAEKSEWNEVVKKSGKILAATTPNGDRLRLGYVYLLNARLALHNQQPAEAVQTLESLLQLAKLSGAAIFSVLVYQFLCQALLSADRPDEAIDTGKQGLALAEQSLQQREIGRICRMLGEAYAEQECFEPAMTYLQRSLDIARHTATPFDQGASLLSLSRLAARMGDPVSSRCAKAEAHLIFQRLGVQNPPN
jgi:DNA-binding SARP family transcriptional activator/tetratricopeptide (TPR) repeat protein